MAPRRFWLSRMKEAWKRRSSGPGGPFTCAAMAGICLLSALSNGCGTIVGLTSPEYLRTTERTPANPEDPVYIGMRLDTGEIARGWSTPNSGEGALAFVLFAFPLLVADTALSTVADTLILPFTMSTPTPSQVKDTGQTLDKNAESRESDNPEYSGWSRWPIGAWRKYTSRSPTGSRVYIDRLLQKNREYLVLGRSSDSGVGQWTLKIFREVPGVSRPKSLTPDGEEDVRVGSKSVKGRRYLWTSGEHWERTWLASEIPGGVLKMEQGNKKAEVDLEEVTLEWGEH